MMLVRQEVRYQRKQWQKENKLESMNVINFKKSLRGLTCRQTVHEK